MGISLQMPLHLHDKGTRSEGMWQKDGKEKGNEQRLKGLSVGTSSDWLKGDNNLQGIWRKEKKKIVKRVRNLRIHTTISFILNVGHFRVSYKRYWNIVNDKINNLRKLFLSLLALYANFTPQK